MSARTQTPYRGRHQAGFTIIELMIALLIGLFLLGGLLTMVQNNKRTFTGQSQLAQLQDGERLTMSIMTDEIQQAGYFTDPTTHSAVSTMPALASPAMTAGQGMVGTYGNVPPGDSITSRYATAQNDGILNCTGASNTTAAVISYANTFKVVSGQLVCQLNIAGVSVTYPLVDGVTNLSILYGINTLGTGNNVDTYMNATQVTAANAWANVIAVHVAVTFTNPLYSAAGAGQPQTFVVQRQMTVMNQIGL